MVTNHKAKYYKLSIYVYIYMYVYYLELYLVSYTGLPNNYMCVNDQQCENGNAVVADNDDNGDGKQGPMEVEKTNDKRIIIMW